jgi:hypothetical protein
MASNNVINVSLCREPTSNHLAQIFVQGGEVQEPTWKGLKRYWRYAAPAQIEYAATSNTGTFAVFCLSVASGQGGIVAVWNSTRRRWEHVSEASYVACALLLEEIHAIVSLHYVARWGIPGHHELFARPLDRTRGGFLDTSIRVDVLRKIGPLRLINEQIRLAAYGDYKPDDNGPLGIFLLNDRKTLIAHDAGNFFKFSMSDIAHSLNN